MPEFRPNLKGVVPDQAEFAIRKLYEGISMLTRRIEATERLRYLTFEQAEMLYGAMRARANLQAAGAAPVNVQGLLGVLAQPQVGGAPSVSALPPLSSPTSQDGALLSLNGQLYRFNGTTEPGFWEALFAQGIAGRGPRASKGSAGANGSFYYETDTGWLYIGTGTGWAYAAGICIGTNAARLALGIGAADNGALFVTTDTFCLWRVEGGAWASKFGWPASNGSYFKHKRVSTGAVAASTYASVTCTWDTAFGSANYTPQASVLEAGTDENSLRVHHIESYDGAGVTVGIMNDDAGNPHTGTLLVTGTLDL